MAAQTGKYDGVHFQVVLMNMRDGSVQGHAEGCADLKRGKAKFAEPMQADEAWDVLSKEEAREGYNADFDEETDGWYDINWMPCADHVPATTETEVTLEDVASAVERSQDITVKVGRKWTYVYRGETLLAEVLTEAADAVVVALGGTL